MDSVDTKTRQIGAGERWTQRLPFLVIAFLLFIGLLGWVNDAWGGLPPILTALLDRCSTFAAIFLSIFFEAAPFLLLGALGSGAIEVLVSQDDLARWLPRGVVTGTLAGGLLGLVFPVCECGVVPFARRLMRKGLPLSSAVTILLAAPVVNPIVIASTLSAFGLGPMLYFRVGISFVIAVVAGMVFSRYAPESALRQEFFLVRENPAPPAQKLPWGKRLEAILRIGADEFFEVGRYLAVGALLAALMQTILPQSALLSIGHGPVFSVLVLLVLAVLLSICSTVDAFIALAFVGVFSPGAILAFLVFGPMVDIKSTILYSRLLNRRYTVILVALPFVMAFITGVAFNLIWR
jgi:uncharacterized protein